MPEFSDLSIALDQVCFFVIKARQIGAKDVVTDADPGSNPSDDGAAAILEDHAGDPVREEIAGLIRALNVDQRLDLITLAILGREDASLEEWASLRTETAQASDDIMRELVTTPLLADHIEDALAKFGTSCAEIETEHL